MAKKINVVLGKNHPLTVKLTPKDQVFKKKSVFWKLPYWEILHVRHYIDVMHIEKNVCESILVLCSRLKVKERIVKVHGLICLPINQNARVK